MSGFWGLKTRTFYNSLIVLHEKTRSTHYLSYPIITWTRSTSTKFRRCNIPTWFSVVSTTYPFAINFFGFSSSYRPLSVQCDHSNTLVESSSPSTTSTTNLIKLSRSDDLKYQTLLRKVYKSLRILARVVQLLFTLAPLAVLYPIRHSLLNIIENNRDKADDDTLTVHTKDNIGLNSLVRSYLSLCLNCVEYSGAAIVKLMQWGSSRPDLFGHAFCSVFERLQDHTTPHSMEKTISLLQQAYGKDWNTHIFIADLIGSGCIGQVYKGQVYNSQGSLQDVAIKVMHPNIRQNIETDLDILRLLAYVAENVPFRIGEHMKWLNLSGIVDEFSRLLTLQLDFRIEARNLNRFNLNFLHDDHVSFPKLVDGYNPTQSVLIETFCEGTPIMKFVAQHRDNLELRKKLCDLGIRTVCKMIFDHNFIHGDLHPGNVFVSRDGDRFILLDAGMVTEYDDKEHDRLVSILSCFLRRDGRKAAELMINDSNDRLAQSNEKARHEDLYIDKIEELTIRACGEDYLMENLGSYITYICEAAANHHVMMNPTFVSAALAVKVQEGVVLSLDPSRSIYAIANPMIVKTEFRRRLQKAINAVWASVFINSISEPKADLI